VRRPTSKGQEKAYSNSHTAVAVVLLSIPFSLSGVLVNWYWWYQPRTWEVFWFSLHQTFATPIWALFSLALLPILSSFVLVNLSRSIFERRNLRLGTGAFAVLVVIFFLASSVMAGVARSYSITDRFVEGGNIVPCTWFVSFDGTTPFAHSQLSTSSVPSPGSIRVGTAGEDITTFLHSVVNSDESICFGAAIFPVGDSAIGLANNLVFSGIPGATIFQLGPGTARHMINWRTVSNFTIYGITFDGNAHGEADASDRTAGELVVLRSPSNNRIVLDRIVCENARNGACLDLGGNNLVVRNSRFVHNSGDAGASTWPVDHIHFGTSVGVRVSDNYFDDCTDTALAMDHVSFAIVVRNTFRDCSGQLWTYTSVGGGASTNATVSDNVFLQTKYLGPAIRIDHFGDSTMAPTAVGVSITSNSFSNVQPGSYDLLELAWASGIAVTDNMIQSASTDQNEYAIAAFSDTDLTVSSNTILNIDSAGAGKDTVFQAIVGFSVIGNTFKTAHVGLEFGCCASLSSNGVVVSNTFDSVANPIIFTTSPTNTIIENNQV